MDLDRAVLMKDQLWEDKDILVFVPQLPARQVDLVITLICHDDPFGIQRPGADHTHDLHRDIDLRVQRGLWGRNVLTDQRRCRLHCRLADRAVILVVPEQDRAGDTGRHSYVQKQVREESASIHVH